VTVIDGRGGVDAGGFLLHADWPYNENTIIRNALMYAEQKYNENTINETFFFFALMCWQIQQRAITGILLMKN
jgi:hypothetical protein